MADTTRNLGLPLIAAGQAQKHVTHNEALDALDVLVHLSVKTRGLNGPPGDPAEGDRYIIGPSPTGAWAGSAGKLAVRRDGVWEAEMPRRGWLAYLEDEIGFVAWNGTAWTGFGESGVQLLAKLLAVDGDGSGLDADAYGGVANETYAALATMRTMIAGGGTITVSASGEVKWSARILATGIGRGGHWSSAGTYEITVPAVGTTVTGLGGAVNRNVTSGGIPLNTGEALYYQPTIGAGSASNPASFRVVGTSTDAALPPGFVCLCLRHPDGGDVVFWNGLKLAGGQSFDCAISNAARPKLTGLGIGTESDAGNALAVASPAVLFNHAGEGVQAKLNKAATDKTASLLFQTGFAGRAEFGLMGSDAVSLKVSADGATFTRAFAVDPASGQVSFDAGALRAEVSVLTASGSWAKPAWARFVTIVCLGGGGGGGSGRRGAASSVRAGGGGGGAGALNAEDFLADELPASLTITIGNGGTGGPAVSADTTNGSAGANGGATSIANGASILLTAVGGGGGGGGATTAGTAGTAGQAQSVAPVGAGGAGSIGAAAGSAGSGGIRGAGGGAGGGGTSAAEAVFAGGASGAGYLIGGASRASASVAGGAVGLGGNGGTGKAWARGAGAGGGGGGAGPANASGSGGAGGTGGIPSGGGGGGGGSTNGAASGAGGAGARGEVWILCRG